MLRKSLSAGAKALVALGGLAACTAAQAGVISTTVTAEFSILDVTNSSGDDFAELVVTPTPIASEFDDATGTASADAQGLVEFFDSLSGVGVDAVLAASATASAREDQTDGEADTLTVALLELVNTSATATFDILFGVDFVIDAIAVVDEIFESATSGGSLVVSVDGQDQVNRVVTADPLASGTFPDPAVAGAADTIEFALTLEPLAVGVVNIEANAFGAVGRGQGELAAVSSPPVMGLLVLGLWWLRRLRP